jgi:hypothetical protein|tara:strand:+ start:671 stop:835 length:165 start_codon:yes stop_codon:yes gene_type:complete
VQDTLQRFTNDHRVLMLELYNELGCCSNAPDEEVGGNLDDQSFADNSAQLNHLA